ncbi:MAG: dihydroorotase [Mediterranea sp.]|jgi:dihydroorotase|nr:dihydroorotase [Mediterranea sp.]
MKKTLIQNATLVNEGRTAQGSVLIIGDYIGAVWTDAEIPNNIRYDEVIDATGCYLLPGVIDDHVHFREPGLTRKGDIFTESRAAAAGGVTSIMDMPNTSPPTVTFDALEAKQELLAERCLVNHSCYFGATMNNYDLFRRLDRTRVCGIKLFMGSSTGNMLVSGKTVLQQIFRHTEDMLLAVHCEDQRVIKRNIDYYCSRYGYTDDMPITRHPSLRSVNACYDSSQLAVRLASENGTRLHLLHLTTDKEVQMLRQHTDRTRISAEVCVGHLLFTANDYATLGSRIKVNPAIKRARHRIALLDAVKDDIVDVIGTDHAPHLLADKQGGALKAASGMPIIQFSLVSMLELTDKHILPIETVVEKMCHAPARLFHIANRGFIRETYYADLVLVRRSDPWQVTHDNILSKCGWSPLEGHTFHWEVVSTFVNGNRVYHQGKINKTHRGISLRFTPWF